MHVTGGGGHCITCQEVLADRKLVTDMRSPLLDRKADPATDLTVAGSPTFGESAPGRATGRRRGARLTIEGSVKPVGAGVPGDF